jgi:thioredoxin reductase (NADPH)
MANHYRLLILGSGPAGCTASIYAARAGLTPGIITGLEQGGQLTKTDMIANWPGEVDGISGMNLMDKMLKHAQKFDSKIIYDSITAADLQQKPIYLKGENAEYTCDALIIATGATAKQLDIPSAAKFYGKGVSACAVCDGFFYRGKEVAVIGGGNTAAEDALYLAAIASKVTIIHRRDTLRAEPILVARLKQTPNISFAWNNIADEILGDEHGVNALRIKDVQTNAKKEIAVDGVFVAIGHQPNTAIFVQQLEMEQGYITTKNDINGASTATNIPGVFAAGDVADQIYRQAITSAGTGCKAAFDAKKYLDGLKS